MQSDWLAKFLVFIPLVIACEAVAEGTSDTDTDGFATTEDDESTGDGTAGEVSEDEAVDAWVSANCEVARDCGCDPSDMACSDWFGEDYLLQFSAAQDANLVYDSACMTVRLEAVANLGCGDTFGPDAIDASGLLGCKVFNGSADVGESCTALGAGLGDSCSSGNRCVDEQCVDATPAGPGEPCIDGLFLPCVDGAACIDAVCEAESSAPPPLGEPCVRGSDDCGFESACGEDDVCVPPLGMGETCFRPWDCGVGLDCGAEGTCVESVPVVCAPFV